jgi:hypothetical protein
METTDILALTDFAQLGPQNRLAGIGCILSKSHHQPLFQATKELASSVACDFSKCHVRAMIAAGGNR